MNRLAKARKLSPAEWWLLLRAGCLLAAAELGLRLLPFREFWSRLSHAGRKVPASHRSVHHCAVEAERIAYLVQVAARYLPGQPTCLRTSAVLYKLLRSRGIEAKLVIGAKRPGETFAAHAWVECGGRVLGGAVPGGFRQLLTVESTGIGFL